MLTNAWPVRVVLAVVTLTAAVALAGCGGGSKAASSAPGDAKAACEALVRTKPTLTHPTDVDWRRLRAAGDLGVAAATADKKKYGDLSQPFAVVYRDALNSETTSIYTDARAALSVCADKKLPH
ncbi:hypothetical protein [Pseudofrankia sp. BMG5.36]|uniref:hypothetical protein n=2 Tax=unclassified Pseudofrankia TaxID=2994372 RepID=UPI001A7E11BD|nr:hypothetical protein [Pseudofrankia sp. BMG5.36]